MQMLHRGSGRVRDDSNTARAQFVFLQGPCSMYTRVWTIVP